jgi:hypothetical protein
MVACILPEFDLLSTVDRDMQDGVKPGLEAISESVEMLALRCR